MKKRSAKTLLKNTALWRQSAVWKKKDNRQGLAAGAWPAHSFHSPFVSFYRSQHIRHGRTTSGKHRNFLTVHLFCLLLLVTFCLLSHLLSVLLLLPIINYYSFITSNLLLRSHHILAFLRERRQRESHEQLSEKYHPGRCQLFQEVCCCQHHHLQTSPDSPAWCVHVFVLFWPVYSCAFVVRSQKFSFLSSS